LTILTKLPNNKIFNTIKQIVEETNSETYVVGGYVRDLLLNRESKDIDILIIGSGIDTAINIANKLNPSIKVSVFKTYGTAMFKYDGIEIEFVGARKESYNKNSRNPIVEEGSLIDDLNRRDFTINAFAISLNKNNYQEFIDKFNGLDDLKNKLIRTPLDPDITFSDDPLRMLRAIRFASQLNFNIDSLAYNAIIKNKERIKIITQERITEELNKIILSKKPSIGFDLLFKTGLLEIIFPEFHNLQGIEVQSNKSHKDIFYHTLEVLDNVSENSDNIWLRWAALLHDIGKPQTKKFEKNHGWTFHGHDYIGSKMVFNIFKNLRLPLNEKLKYVQKLVKLHLRPISLSNEQVTDSAIRRLLFDAGTDIDDLMILCSADITSKIESKVEKFKKNFILVRQKTKEIEEKDRICNWQPPISGEDIMQTFNLSPCKEVGLIKNAIKEAVLEGIISNNREEAFEFMLTKAEELGLIPNKNE